MIREKVKRKNKRQTNAALICTVWNIFYSNGRNLVFAKSRLWHCFRTFPRSLAFRNITPSGLSSTNICYRQTCLQGWYVLIVRVIQTEKLENLPKCFFSLLVDQKENTKKRTLPSKNCFWNRALILECRLFKRTWSVQLAKQDPERSWAIQAQLIKILRAHRMPFTGRKVLICKKKIKHCELYAPVFIIIWYWVYIFRILLKYWFMSCRLST